MSTKFQTALKFSFIAYNGRIKEEYADKISIDIFAKDERDALIKAGKLAKRKTIQLLSVVEIIDVYQFTKNVVKEPNGREQI